MAQRYAHAMQSDNHDVMAQLAETYSDDRPGLSG